MITDGHGRIAVLTERVAIFHVSRHGSLRWASRRRRIHVAFGFFYFWKSHVATVTGSTERHVRCFNCDTVFEYHVIRTARGGGHSPLHLNPHGAAEDAKRRAWINLDRALQNTVELVYCPTCGVFQP